MGLHLSIFVIIDKPCPCLLDILNFLPFHGFDKSIRVGFAPLDGRVISCQDVQLHEVDPITMAVCLIHTKRYVNEIADDLRYKKAKCNFTVHMWK